MRTTLTIEPDAARKLKRRMAHSKISLKQAVNEALRAGLAHSKVRAKPKFRVEPHPCRFRPGIDLDKLNQLVDVLEVELPDSGSRL